MSLPPVDNQSNLYRPYYPDMPPLLIHRLSQIKAFLYRLNRERIDAQITRLPSLPPLIPALSDLRHLPLGLLTHRRLQTDIDNLTFTYE